MTAPRARCPALPWLALFAIAMGPVACDAGPVPQSQKQKTLPAAGASSTAPSARPDVEFIETLTAGARATEPLPMVVAIHGLGDDPRHFGSVLRGLGTPARLVFPRGLEPYHDGWSWFAFSRGDVERNAAGIRNAANRLSTLVAWLVANRTTAGKPVVTGFSQGGMITFALAVHHPDVVGSAYPMGGVLPESLWPRAKESGRVYPPIFALHGTDDPLVPIEPTRRGVDHLRELGFAAELRTYEGVGHSVSRAMQADLVARIDADCRSAKGNARAGQK